MDEKKLKNFFLPGTGLYLWAVALLIILIAWLDWHVAIPCLIILGLLIHYKISADKKQKKGLTDCIEKLSFDIDGAVRNVLLGFPMPLAIIDPDGSVIWQNSAFKDISGKENVQEKVVKIFLEEISAGKPAEKPAGKPAEKPAGKPAGGPDGIFEQHVVSRQIELAGIQYQVQCCYQIPAQTASYEAEPSDGSAADMAVGAVNVDSPMLFYFVDINELSGLKKIYANERIVTGIIMIDNYDELMQSLGDSNKSQILAEIDKKVNQWMGFTKGILRKYDRDKYLLIFEHKYMKDFELSKFEILDSVKEISKDKAIPITLSMGFGLNGTNLLENLRSAAAAIDVALGRGGDQAVVKSGGKFTFFGGKTRAMEKKTKVKARAIAYALRELIEQSSAIFIMGHEKPDIDSLGASLGVYRMAAWMGKNAYIVFNGSNPGIETLAARIQESTDHEGVLVNREEALAKADEKSLLVIVDTHRPSFTELPELIDLAGQIVVIDHHRRGVDYIQDTALTYQETYASSASELVTELLQYFGDGIRLKKIEAEALFAGIVVDTKNFTFKAGVRTFEAASHLRRQGIDTVSVKQLFQNDLATYISISEVVRSAEMVDPEIAVSLCPPDTYNAQLVSAKAADELLNLSGIKAAFVLGAVENEIFISGRSLGDVNVQLIMEKLGGGGHLTMAGAQLTNVTMKDAKDRLKYAIMEYVESLAEK